MAIQYRGVNFPAYAFDKSAPYEYGKGYVMPGFDEQTGTKWTGDAWLDYWVKSGMNCFPVQFQWEIMQPNTFTELNQVYLGRLNIMAAKLRDKGCKMVLTPHFKVERGGLPVTVTALADLWRRLAVNFRNDSVIFNIFAEPARPSVEDWVLYANEAIAAIRIAGNTNEILVGAGGYSGARSFFETWYGEKSSTALLRVKDPLDKVTFDIHHYVAENWSGTYPNNEVGQTVPAALKALSDVTYWAVNNGKKLYLGEFGTPNTSKGLDHVTAILNHLQDNYNQWTGWAWWSAGPWQKGYKLSIEPTWTGGNAAPSSPIKPYGYDDAPQMKWLRDFLPIPTPPITDLQRMEGWTKDSLAKVSSDLTAGAWKTWVPK